MSIKKILPFSFLLFHLFACSEEEFFLESENIIGRSYQTASGSHQFTFLEENQVEWTTTLFSDTIVTTTGTYQIKGNHLELTAEGEYKIPVQVGNYVYETGKSWTVSIDGVFYSEKKWNAQTMKLSYTIEDIWSLGGGNSTIKGLLFQEKNSHCIKKSK